MAILTKASAITGYSTKEMLGSLLVEAEVVLPEFKPAMQQVISNAMSGINTENFELPLYSRLGHRVELLLNATSRHSAGEAVVGVVMVGQVTVLSTALSTTLQLYVSWLCLLWLCLLWLCSLWLCLLWPGHHTEEGHGEGTDRSRQGAPPAACLLLHTTCYLLPTTCYLLPAT